MLFRFDVPMLDMFKVVFDGQIIDEEDERDVEGSGDAPTSLCNGWSICFCFLLFNEFFLFAYLTLMLGAISIV